MGGGQGEKLRNDGEYTQRREETGEKGDVSGELASHLLEKKQKNHLGALKAFLS